jgi:hypothetical protein
MLKVLERAHDAVLEARSVEYLLKTRTFENTWKMASEEERRLLVDQPNWTQKSVKSWINIVRARHIEILNSRELKDIARKLCIPNYSRTSAEVLREIITRIWANEHRENNTEDSKVTIITGHVRVCIETSS